MIVINVAAVLYWSVLAWGAVLGSLLTRLLLLALGELAMGQ